MNLTTGTFRRGAEAAREASKGGGSFARTHYFSIQDGEQAILRFITDEPDWIVVDQHQNIPTRQRPADWPKDAKWPQRMGAVCRKDQAFEGMFDDCFICDNIVGTGGVKRPTARVWAWAVLREQVIEDGKVVGVRDLTREVIKTDKDGKGTGETTIEKAIVIVNMGFKNFFGTLQGFAGHYGTLLDRDYLIKRQGTGTDTDYMIIPRDPIQTQDGTIFDLREPKFMERYPLPESLEELVVSRADDEFYARFFDTRVESPKMKKSDGDDAPKGAQPPAQQSNDVSDVAALEALRNRVVGHGQSSPSPETSPSPEAEVAGKPAPSGGMRNFD